MIPDGSERVRLGSSLRAWEMNAGETVIIEASGTESYSFELVSTRATVDSSSTPYPPALIAAGAEPHTVAPALLKHRADARIVLRMHATVRIDGVHYELVRFVGSQRSFYEPWEIGGLRIWFDACEELFLYLRENHGRCRPGNRARFAVQAAERSVSPVLLHPWCPLPAGGLRIDDAYAGSDCWMGPYMGADAHGGLDVNHAAGTPIWAPFSLDRQVLFNSLAAGDTNNRWEGYRTWDDGWTWRIGVHHVSRVHPVPEVAVEGGTLVADGAGVAVGAHEHSHFTFAVTPPTKEPGRVTEPILLDPWILFWQMYRDREMTGAR